MANQTIVNIVKKLLCKDVIWDFSEEMRAIYNNELSRHDNNKGYGINPASLEEVETNIDTFFPRHFLKIQHSLYDLLCDNNLFVEEGMVNFIDVGCGPGTASLAVLDFCFQLLYSYNISGIDYPYSKPLKFNFILTDSSPYCLLKAQSLITDYFQYIVKKYSGVEEYLDIQPKLITFSSEYPDVLSEIESIIDCTGKFNLVCFSNVLVQIKNKCKCTSNECNSCSSKDSKECKANKKISDSLKLLKNFIDTNEKNSFIMILQEIRSYDLIDPILPYENIKSYKATMKQKNYSPLYPNDSYDAKYGRAFIIENQNNK